MFEIKLAECYVLFSLTVCLIYFLFKRAELMWQQCDYLNYPMS